MTESDAETEDDILARIETALQKIAAAGTPAARPAGREQLAGALDRVIHRLRDGLEPPGPDPAPGATRGLE